MCAWEWLDRQMYPLMSLQIVVTVEALWTLVALERAVIGRWLLVLVWSEEMRHSSCVSTVESLHHSGMNAADQS
jgi:hypothetical protein